MIYTYLGLTEQVSIIKPIHRHKWHE